MNNSIFSILQRVGRAFMLPIALLPVAGLMLGIGASFTNETTIHTYSLEGILGNGTILHSLFTVMSNAGDIIFSNLPILFATGVAVGMAKSEKEVAGIAGIVGFIVMHATINSLLSLKGLLEPGALPEGAIGDTVGIQTLQMGVFGGMIVGLGTAALHNKFYKIQLPTVISFFGGTRFVPIITALVYLIVGIVCFYIWPQIQDVIILLGTLVNNTGYFGTFIYGVIERSLIPFGLHHVFYMPFWQTAVGGTAVIDGELIVGAQNIFFAQLASPNTTVFDVEATKFMAGKFPFMMFGIPGAALAIYHTAKPENRKAIYGLLASATLTVILTGITEPLEFSFLFAAPLLYVIHCIYAGLSFMLVHIFDVGVGQTFSGSLIDLILFGVLQGNEKTNWINIILIGVPLFPIYYFTFRTLIKKFNFKTPGREESSKDVKLYTRKDYKESKGIENTNEDNNDITSELIIKGLGGKDNISYLDCCATRLRVTVIDPSLVDKDILKSSGAKAVIQKVTGIQVIYGPQVSVIKSNLEEYYSKDTDTKH